jgi:hypothetical protein
VLLRALALACLLVTAPLSVASAAPITAFYFTSSPESFIGHGETFQGSLDDGLTFYTNAYGFYGVGLTIRVPGTPPLYGDAREWDLLFSTADGAPLVAGTYFSVIGPVTASLDFSGNGRGDSTRTGSFQVLEYSVDPHYGFVESLAIDFTQYDEGNLSWWNVGSVRFNSEIPLTTPEPGATSLALLAGLFAVARRFPVD